MSREWKVGDVALVEAGCWANRKIALRLAEGWAHFNGVSLDDTGIVTALRPLVVIDPEDREQVRALADLAFPEVQGNTNRLQEALRSLVAEPEPEEPTGLGAVVRDGNGSDWVRIYQHVDCNDWRRTDDEPGSGEAQARSGWLDLPRPLTVLSPGWEPEQ